MSAFEDELASGFAELDSEAGTGTALSFKGVPLSGVLGEASPDPLRTDTKLGPAPLRLGLMVSRAVLATLPTPPKTGDAFDYGTGKLSIKGIEDEDPTDPVVTFIVKRV